MGLNEHETLAYNGLIEELKRRKAQFHLSGFHLIIKKSNYMLIYDLTYNKWWINNTEKQITLKGNENFFSFYYLAMELIKGNFTVLDIHFKDLKELEDMMNVTD